MKYGLNERKRGIMDFRERLNKVEEEVKSLRNTFNKFNKMEGINSGEKTYFVSVSAITVAPGTSYVNYDEREKAFTALLMKEGLIKGWVEREHEGDIFCQGYDDITINIHTTNVRIARKYVAALNAVLPQASKDERRAYDLDWNAQAVLGAMDPDGGTVSYTEEENWQIQ